MSIQYTMLSGLPEVRKSFARIGDIVCITGAGMAPRYVNLVSLRSGLFGLAAFDAAEKPAATPYSDGATGLSSSVYYSLAVVGVDERQYSPDGRERATPMSLPSTPCKPAASQSIGFSIPVHTQKASYENGTPSISPEVSRRDLYLSVGGSSAEAAAGPFLFCASIADNTTLSWNLTTETRDPGDIATSDLGPAPDDAFLCAADLNRVFVASKTALYWSEMNLPSIFPLLNTVAIPTEPRGLCILGGYVLVFFDSQILRFSTDAPEQGPFVVSANRGTKYQQNIVHTDSGIYFWDGFNVSMTDGNSTKQVTLNRCRDLMGQVDLDREDEIVGGYEKLTETVHFHFPLVGHWWADTGVEINLQTGDIYPVVRDGVECFWSFGQKLRYSTPTRQMFEMDPLHDEDGGGLPAQYLTGVHGPTGSGVYPVNYKGHLEDNASWGFGVSGGQYSGTLIDEDGSMVVLPIGGSAWDGDLSLNNVEVELPVSGAVYPTVTNAILVHGGTPLVYGTKHHDFDSSRYLHRVYDLEFDFMPMSVATGVVVSFFKDLSSTPFLTKYIPIPAETAKLQIPVKWHPMYQFGFRFTFLGGAVFKMLQYTITWATLR